MLRDGSDGHYALFALHLMWITGDLDIHDVALPEGGRPVYQPGRFQTRLLAISGWVSGTGTG